MTDEQASPPTGDPSTPGDATIDGEELTEEEREVLANVARILRRIRFGTVVLTGQDVPPPVQVVSLTGCTRSWSVSVDGTDE